MTGAIIICIIAFVMVLLELSIANHRRAVHRDWKDGDNTIRYGNSDTSSGWWGFSFDFGCDGDSGGDCGGGD